VGLAVSSIKDKVNLVAGEEVGHIIDPRNGYPARGVAQAIVVGPTATACDVLATALSVAGVEDTPSVLYNFDRYHAMLILNEEPLTVWMSSGMEDYVALDGIPDDHIHVLPDYKPTEAELAGGDAPLIQKKLPDWDMRVFSRPGDKKDGADEDRPKRLILRDAQGQDL
jgi:hypothetical protein